jgi:undecaprenyl-diphosphatase
MPASDAHLPLRHALALGALHGPAELLPISSSGHTELVPWLLDWPYAELDGELRKAFEVALHAGTAAALLIGLHDEVSEAAHGLDRRRLILIAGSFVPPAIAGLTLERVIEERLGSAGPIAAGLAVGAVVLWIADATAGGERPREDAGLADALILGAAQILALAPGMSRNGMTLAAARWRGFGRRDANALSRHVALPVIVGATALKGTRLARRGLTPSLRRAFAAGAGASFVSTLASTWIIRLVERGRSPAPYVLYRLGFAAIVARALRNRAAARVDGENLRGQGARR